MKIDLRKIETYYINMEKDINRNKSMQGIIKEFGFQNAKRSDAVSKPNDPLSGCANSHYNILSSIKDKTIILEDDCVIKNKKHIIEVPDDADAVYLGLSEWGFNRDTSKKENFTFSKHKDFEDVYKVSGMLATHAILYITEDYINTCKIVSKYSSENSVHVDQGFARIQRYFNVYALANPVFYQSSNADATDIIFKRDRILGG